MDTSTLADTFLSDIVLNSILLTDDEKIRTEDLEVTPMISSSGFVEYDDNNLSTVISALNRIIAAFKGEQPPEPPTPKMFMLMLSSVGNDTSSIVDNVCTFSPESGTEVLEDTIVQLSVIPSTIYGDLKYTFLHWSDDATLTSPVREV